MLMLFSLYQIFFEGFDQKPLANSLINNPSYIVQKYQTTKLIQNALQNHQHVFDESAQLSFLEFED